MNLSAASAGCGIEGLEIAARLDAFFVTGLSQRSAFPTRLGARGLQGPVLTQGTKTVSMEIFHLPIAVVCVIGASSKGGASNPPQHRAFIASILSRIRYNRLALLTANAKSVSGIKRPNEHEVP